MLFHNGKYKIRKYYYKYQGGMLIEKIHYSVYIPIYFNNLGKGIFGMYLDPNTPSYYTLKEALGAMNKHYNSVK
jgi:hypothetical protein